MSKFIFGGQEVEVPVLCLAAIRLASRVLPEIMPKPGDPVDDPAYKIGQTEKTFDAFLQILACQLEDDDDPAKSVWTYRKLERTIQGAKEMAGILEGMWALLQESGFVKKGEPQPAALGQALTPPAPAPATPTA